MRKRRLGPARGAALLAAAVLWSGLAPAAESAAVKTARKIVEKHKDAIVQVRMVLKIKTVVGGRQMGSRERKSDVNGTVIDPSGLTVISNVATDPSSMYSTSMGEDNPRFKMETTVTDIKIVLADGKEYPAKLVLRDKDLDLAFIRPDRKGLKLPCLKLKKAPEPKLLDEIIGISRLDRSANREPAVAVGRIMAVIRKPRVRYVAMTLMETGCPAFDSAGNVLGLSLMRTGGQRGSSGFSMISFMPAILPCEDILEVVKQVPPPEKEGEKKAPPAAEEKKPGKSG